MAGRPPEQTTGELPPDSPLWTYDIPNGKALNSGLPKLPGLNVEIFFGVQNNRPRWLIVPAPWTVLPKENTPGGTDLQEKRADPKSPKFNGAEIFCWEFDPPPEQKNDRELYRHAYDALRESLRNPRFREEVRDYIQQRFPNLLQNREDVLPRLPMPPDGRPSLKRQEAIPNTASPQYSWFDRPMLVSKPGSAISAGNALPGADPTTPPYEATSPSYAWDDDDPEETANPAPIPGPSDGETEPHAEVAHEGGLNPSRPSPLSNQENIPISKLPRPKPTTQTSQPVPKEAAAAAAPPPPNLPDPIPTNQAGQQISKGAAPPPAPEQEGEGKGEGKEATETTTDKTQTQTSRKTAPTPWRSREYTDKLVQAAADTLLKNAPTYWPPGRIRRRMRMWSGVEIRDRTTIGLEGQIDQLPPFPGKFDPSADAVGTTLKRKRGRAPKAAAAAADDASKQAAPEDGDGDGDGDQAPKPAAKRTTKQAPTRDVFSINTRTHGSFSKTARKCRRSKRISRASRKKKK